MKVLSEIRGAGGRRDRFEVVIEGEVVATLSARDIGDLKLREGAQLDSDMISRIQVAGERLRVFDRAIRMLAVAPRSMFDLRRRLILRGESRAAVAWAVARVESEGIFSDEMFAVQFARARFARGASRSAVLSGLLRAAVGRPLAERVVSDLAVADAPSEGERAIHLARKKARSLGELEPRVARRRLIGFLRRRGYTASDVAAAIAKVQLGSDVRADGDGGDAAE